MMDKKLFTTLHSKICLSMLFVILFRFGLCQDKSIASSAKYSKTCVKTATLNKTENRLMQVRSIAQCSKEHSAILLTFIKLLFVIKKLSIFEWSIYTGFDVPMCVRLLARDMYMGQHVIKFYLSQPRKITILA